MKKATLLLVALLMAMSGMAQIKVAILPPVDKGQNVSYGIKLLLRSSLTSAISNTPGYEGYDRVDMASIAGEQEFQRTGNVSDDQIKQLGIATGAAYVLVAEAAKYDATSIIIAAKIIDVETFGIISSDVQVSGTNAGEMQKSCNELAGKLLKTSGSQKTVTTNVPSASNPIAITNVQNSQIQTVLADSTPKKKKKTIWSLWHWYVGGFLLGALIAVAGS